MDDGRIPVVLCIDCEPDEQVWALDSPSAWSGFEHVVKGTARLRDRLERATRAAVHFSWALRMDPQIGMSYGTTSYLPERFSGFFEAIDRSGDQLGVHPHAWRWDARETTWTADHQDASWVSTCVATAYESYREAFGQTPLFHRFGDGFMSTDVMNMVRAEGSAFDLTLEPGLHRARRRPEDSGLEGELPHFPAIPRVPYCPERTDFSRSAGRADDAFLAVPLSSGRYIPPPATRRRLAHPLRSARSVARRLRPQSVIHRPPYQPLAMWRRWRSPTDFWNSAFAAAAELERPYLAFAIRSDPAIPDGTIERVDSIMDALSEDPRAARLEFTTVDRVHGPLH